jgi:hypothetical protein
LGPKEDIDEKEDEEEDESEEWDSQEVQTLQNFTLFLSQL